MKAPFLVKPSVTDTHGCTQRNNDVLGTTAFWNHCRPGVIPLGSPDEERRAGSLLPVISLLSQSCQDKGHVSVPVDQMCAMCEEESVSDFQ